MNITVILRKTRRTNHKKYDRHASPNLSAVVSKVNLTTNNKNWWVDIGATRHICSEKILFADYKKLEHDEQLFMRNSPVSKVERKGKVILK